MNGTVSRLFIVKGFGFIMGEDGLSRFMHVRDFTRAGEFERLREGQGVTFIPSTDEEAEAGPTARCPDCGAAIRVVLESSAKGKGNNRLRAIEVAACP